MDNESLAVGVGSRTGRAVSVNPAKADWRAVIGLIAYPEAPLQTQRTLPSVGVIQGPNVDAVVDRGAFRPMTVPMFGPFVVCVTATAVSGTRSG